MAHESFADFPRMLFVNVSLAKNTGEASFVINKNGQPAKVKTEDVASAAQTPACLGSSMPSRTNASQGRRTRAPSSNRDPRNLPLMRFSSIIYGRQGAKRWDSTVLRNNLSTKASAKPYFELRRVKVWGLCAFLAIELRKHAEERAKNPAGWMPWNYRQTRQQAGTGRDPHFQHPWLV
jgi:hypothetical protein